MAEGTEPIRQDIEGIRDSMTETLEQIEARVRGTVDTTVDNVRQVFDVKRQVSERPWLSLGLAVAAGYVLGSMGGDSEPERPQYGERGQAMRYYPEHGYRPETGSQSYGSGQDYSSGGSQGYSSGQSYGGSGQSYGGGSGQSYGGSGSQGFTPSSGFSASQHYGQARQSQMGGVSMGMMGGLLSRIAGPMGDELQTMAQAAVNSAIRMLRENLQTAIPQFDAEYQRARGDRFDGGAMGGQGGSGMGSSSGMGSGSSYGSTGSSGGSSASGVGGGSVYSSPGTTGTSSGSTGASTDGGSSYGSAGTSSGSTGSDYGTLGSGGSSYGSTGTSSGSTGASTSSGDRSGTNRSGV